MSRILTVAASGLSIALISLTLSNEASAKTCTRGVCVSGADDGRTVSVAITHTIRPPARVTHYNVQYNGIQKEVQFFFNMDAGGRSKQVYAVQACNRGGFLQASACGPWVRFHHTMTR